MHPFNLIQQVFAEEIVGTINAPGGVPQVVGDTGGFISGIVRFIIVIAGLFAFWNFLTGGLEYITSGGDKAKLTNAQQKILMSIVGLVIIAASFLITALIGLLLYNNPRAILNPQLTTIK